MPDRLTDIKETGALPGHDVGSWTIQKRKGTFGHEFTITVPEILSAYGPNADITFKGMQGFVVERRISAAEGGWISEIICNEDIGRLARKAPRKSLMYMSMTERELEDFQIACKENYSNLDYVPLIRICDPEDRTGGWNSNDVISDLANRAGITVYNNCYNYWLRQIHASSGSSFMDTILSIISFLMPIVYTSAGVVYLLDDPLHGGVVELDKLKVVSQREVLNPDAQVTQIKVKGGMGKWIRSKYKGYTQDPKESTVTTVSEKESAVMMKVTMSGTTETIDKMTGKKTVADGAYTASTPMSKPMNDKTTAVETWMLDVFGNPKYMISKQVTTYNTLVGEVTAKRIESHEYEFTGEGYERPRLKKMVATVGRYSWMIVQTWGAKYRYFKPMVDLITTVRTYADNGALLEEYETRETDVVRLSDEPGMWVETSLADIYYSADGSEEYETTLGREIVEEKITRYRQLTPDIYEKHVTIRQHGGFLRAIGDGFHRSIVTQVRGRVPKYPRIHRLMQVYAEEFVETEGVMDAPAIVVSNPNIVSWEDAERIKSIIKRKRVAPLRIVVRDFTVPADIPIDVGWRVSFGSIDCGGAEIPAISPVTDNIIAGFSKSKDAAAGQVVTAVSIEGKAS